MTDILADIDDTLAHWAWSADAARWNPSPPIPRLNLAQAEVARRVSAQTGVDGFAAAFMVADVAEHGMASPHWDAVLPAGRMVADEMTDEAAAALAAVGRVFREMFDQLGRAMTARARQMMPVFADLGKSFHLIGAASSPRAHRYCGTCHPHRSGKLAVNGREYHRRQQARTRRKQ